MRLPEGFKRARMKGPTRGAPVHGWAVRIGTKACFVPLTAVRRPSGVRKILEQVLGIKRGTDEESRVVRISRVVATTKRQFRNDKAAGKDTMQPWNAKRTLSVIKGEERTIGIALKWQRMGEYRK